ncbi:MAG TPA: hypothetical protein VHW26_07450 [Solirubrobacteraceae bacterium]|jgi:hypothetical protein|nr:hypothetical protein [Solirubrobacteraceae bacterium]
MPSPQLHVCLHEFAEQAAFVLAAAADAGSEVGYEVVPEGGRGNRPALYCYRALTGEFIERHRDALRSLPSYQRAVGTLAGLDGLGSYLDARGLARPDGGQATLAEAALRCFVERVFYDSNFSLAADRFEPAYRELEQAAIEGRAQAVVVALLRGITTESDQVPLGDGALLAPPDCLEDLPPDPAWSGGDSHSLAVAIAPGDGPDGLTAALDRLGDIQTAMRLFAPGIGFAPLAWVRGQESGWRPLAAPLRGRGGGLVTIAADQEDELRAFCNLVARRRPIDGQIAWALERFELGCERADELIGFSDHLLALRAMLEPEGVSGHLPGRLAALCAVADERARMADRVSLAIDLEVCLIAGLEPIPAGARTLTHEIEAHLRALLRDVICGHLPDGLADLADELIGSTGDPDPTAVTATPAAGRLHRRSHARTDSQADAPAARTELFP